MQLGFVTAILPELSLQEVLEFGAAEGFACAEVMCWPRGKAERRYAGVTHVDVTDFGPADVQQVRKLTQASGVAHSSLGYYPNALVADRAEAAVYVEHLRKLIRAAAMPEIGLVTTFIGRNPAQTVDDNWPRLLEVWPPLLDFARQQGVRIGIENCPMFFTRDEWPGGKNLATTPGVWRRLFAELGEGLGLNYDPSHFIWQQMDYLKPLAEFAPRIFHAHAKDAKVDRQRLSEVGIMATPLEYHQPKLPGLGDVDWTRFLAELARVGYAGPVCIEVEDRDFEGSLDARKRALRQSAAHLRQCMPKA